MGEREGKRRGGGSIGEGRIERGTRKEEREASRREGEKEEGVSLELNRKELQEYAFFLEKYILGNKNDKSGRVHCHWHPRRLQ